MSYKSFELNSKSFQVRRPTLGIVKEVERKFGRDSETTRNMATLQRCLQVQAGESGAYRGVTDAEFDALSVDEMNLIQRHQDSLAPLEVRRRVSAAEMMDVLPTTAPPAVAEYLLKLAVGPAGEGEEGDNPLA